MSYNNNNKDPSPAANNIQMTQESLEAGDEDKARRQLGKVDIETLKNMEIHCKSDLNMDLNYWEKEVTTDQEVPNEGERAYDETVLRFALKIGGIMEAIVNYLDDQHLDPWYETCKAFKFHDLNDG